MLRDAWLRWQVRIVNGTDKAEKNDANVQETFNETPELLAMLNEQLPHVIGTMGGLFS